MTELTEVNLREDFPIHESFYLVQATDKDRHEVINIFLYTNNKNLF